MNQSQTLQPGEALLLSLAIAIQQERIATGALDQARSDLDARHKDMGSARKSVELASEAISQFAAKVQIAVEVSPDRTVFYAQALQSGVMHSAEGPVIGIYWKGQGGIYGGIRQYPDGPNHIIFGEKDLGDFAWGALGTETGATHRIHGVLNTSTLRDTDGSFPAAEAANEYAADGHHDFYLPSIGELNHAWQCIPEVFDKGAWYWSSTKRSANHAVSMYFAGGSQTIIAKYVELRVRPVRRLPIQ